MLMIIMDVSISSWLCGIQVILSYTEVHHESCAILGSSYATFFEILNYENEAQSIAL